MHCVPFTFLWCPGRSNLRAFFEPASLSLHTTPHVRRKTNNRTAKMARYRAGYQLPVKAISFSEPTCLLVSAKTRRTENSQLIALLYNHIREGDNLKWGETNITAIITFIFGREDIKFAERFIPQLPHYWGIVANTFAWNETTVHILGPDYPFTVFKWDSISLWHLRGNLTVTLHVSHVYCSAPSEL